MILTPLEALAEMFDLTPKQAEVLAEIMAYRDRHGYSPNVRELAMAICGSPWPNASHRHLRALKKKGALTWESGSERTMVPRVRFIPA